MVTTYYPFGAQQFYLGSSCGSTDTTILLSSFTEPVSGIPYTMTYLNTGIVYGTIAPQTTSSEFISFTGIIQNSNGTALLTGVVRGLAKAYPFTSSSTFQLPHAGQSIFIISDVPQVFQEYLSLNSPTTVNSVVTFAVSPIVPTGGTGTQAANNQDIANAISGASGTATNTTFGTVKLSVPAVSTPNPIVMGSNDPLISPVSLATLTSGEIAALAGTSGTPGSGNKYVTNNDTATVATANSVVRTLGSGLIDPSFLTGAVESLLVSTQIAGASITIGEPLTNYWYQSDGGVEFDAMDISSISSGTTVTKSFTTGNNANRILIVAIDSNIAPSTVTYGGIAMTSLISQALTDGSYTLYTYYLIAPATGANNIIVTLGSTGNANIHIRSYYNAKQTGQPDTSGKNVAGTNTVANSLSTVANGSRIVAFGAGGTGWTSGTMTSITNAPNNFQSSSANVPVSDSDTIIVFPGTTSVTNTIPAQLGGSGHVGIIQISIAPATIPLQAVVPSSSVSVAFGQNLYTAFIGFAASTVSAGINVGVIIGGIATGLSALTPNTKYYLNDTVGTIGTSAGTNSKSVGIALSATTILVANMI